MLGRLSYAVTDRRALVRFTGRNMIPARRTYRVSCKDRTGFAVPIAGSRPFPSLAVGLLLSQDGVLPFGQRLIHPGWPPLATRGVIPILFEQIEDAERVRDLLLNGAYATASNRG